jgi:hypothetical protein
LKSLFSKRLIKYSVLSALFTSAAGTLLHFVYEWSGNNRLVGVFSAINESTFEHLKLLFWPFLLTTFIGLFLFPEKRRGFIASSAVSVLLGMLSIIVLFYTYSGALGKFYSAINIAIFFISVIFSYYMLYAFMKNSTFDFNFSGFFGVLIFILLIASIISFTFLPPKIALFQDPLTKSFGFS